MANCMFNLRSFREMPSTSYHARRLLLQAITAKRLGHNVVVHLPAGDIQFTPRPPDLVKLLAQFEVVAGVGPCKLGPDWIYFCTKTYMKFAANIVPPRTKVVVWNDTLALGDAKVVFPRADAVLALVTCPEDFTEPEHKSHRWIKEANWPDRNKVISVPFVSHDALLKALWKDGTLLAYLDDDLPAMRKTYGVKKQRMAGFIGGNLPVRSSKLGATLKPPTYEIVWAGGHHPLVPPLDMLRWVSECRACLHLPGDTWKCSRMMDAIMMGVPLLQLRNTIDVDPPLTDENAILVDDWADEAALMAGLERSDEIVANADKAYHEGWSLRGQLLQSLKRIGVT